jgi:hypothetical protein
VEVGLREEDAAVAQILGLPFVRFGERQRSGYPA